MTSPSIVALFPTAYSLSLIGNWGRSHDRKNQTLIIGPCAIGRPGCVRCSCRADDQSLPGNTDPRCFGHAKPALYLLRNQGIARGGHILRCRNTLGRRSGQSTSGMGKPLSGRRRDRVRFKGYIPGRQWPHRHLSCSSRCHRLSQHLLLTVDTPPDKGSSYGTVEEGGVASFDSYSEWLRHLKAEGYASAMGNVKERTVQPSLFFSRGILFALVVALVALLLLSVVVQVWVWPAAVERTVSLFPEVGSLAGQAILWGVCAVLCWQVIAVIGLELVRRALGNRADSSIRRWIGAVIGCLLVFAALVTVAFIALNERGYTPPGVMLGLVTAGLIALISAGALAVFLGSNPPIEHVLAELDGGRRGSNRSARRRILYRPRRPSIWCGLAAKVGASPSGPGRVRPRGLPRPASHASKQSQLRQGRAA